MLVIDQETANNFPSENYIFQENEFDGPIEETFNAAAFIAKYRRVATLESLREQLSQYSDEIQQQLYQIINRDYRDFIQIATKLDGVDDRIAHLRQPLVDLRLDLSGLHDGMVASINAIQEKLHRKVDILFRKQILEYMLSCSAKLDSAETILGIRKFADDKSMNRRSLLCIINSSTSNGFDSELFECSEIERAAYSLKEAKKSYVLLKQLFSKSSNEDFSLINTSTIMSSFDQRLTNISESLTLQLQSRVVTFLNSIPSLPSDYDASKLEVCNISVKPFIHLVRSLIIINQSTVVEEAVQQSIVLPLLKVLLTQGRIDGTGGRGSYAGLSNVLREIIMHIRFMLQSMLISVEELQGNQMSIDIIIKGIWEPITKMLHEKFSGIFTSAIPDSFARCFIAYQSFRADIISIAGDKFFQQISYRMSNHPAVVSVDALWQLDIYFHLRSQHIMSSVDSLSEDALRKGLLYKTKEAKNSINQSSHRFQLSFFRGVISELFVCCDKYIMLKPLVVRFLSLIFKILLRVEAFIVVLADIPSTEFNRQNILQVMESANSDAGGVDNSTTNKKPPNQKNATIQSIGIDDVALVGVEINTFISWLEESLKSIVMDSTKVICDFELSSDVSNLIEFGITKHSSRFRLISDSLWMKVCDFVSTDCKVSEIALMIFPH